MAYILSEKIFNNILEDSMIFFEGLFLVWMDEFSRVWVIFSKASNSKSCQFHQFHISIQCNKNTKSSG